MVNHAKIDPDEVSLLECYKTNLYPLWLGQVGHQHLHEAGAVPGLFWTSLLDKIIEDPHDIAQDNLIDITDNKNTSNCFVTKLP